MRHAVEILKTLLYDPSLIKTSSQAKQLHANAIKLTGHGFSSPELTGLIISIYANFSLLQDCLSLLSTFGSSPPPAKAWKSVIKCCASNGDFVGSVSFFKEMWASGVVPTRNMFPSLLKTCVHLRNLILGEAFHASVLKLGLDTELFTGNALMNMYAKLGPLGACKVFDGSPQPTRSLGFNKDLGNTETWLRLLHNSTEGFCIPQEQNNFLSDTGVDIEKKGAFLLDSVWKVFEKLPDRDVVSYNTVIGGLLQNGMHDEALSTIKLMGNSNVKPDSYTLSSILPIFSQHVDLAKGKEAHTYAIRHSFDQDVFLSSSLIDMYANCSRLVDSHKVFRSSPHKDSVSWNSIIAVCVQNGSFDNGLKLFREMLSAGFQPVAVSFSSIMPACAHLTTLCLGRHLHGCVIRRGFGNNIYVASSLVDMYSKCGSLRLARWVFDRIGSHDAVSWTAMIMAYALHGCAHKAVSSFDEMEAAGVEPTPASFLAVLTACSHGGLVDRAWRYFTSMTRDYSISPCIDHYAAISDLLGRAGRLDEAYRFISEMKTEPTGAIWSSLLSACRVQKNVDLAEKVSKEMLKIDPQNEGGYILLSNVYIAAGRWKEATERRIKMRRKGLTKTSACSWIEARNEVHVFVSGDVSHPDSERITRALRDLTERIARDGYVPDTNAVLHN